MMLFSGLALVAFSSFLVPTRSEYINPGNCAIVFYYGPTFEDSISYPLTVAAEVVNHPEFKHDKTVWFIPDYHEPQLEGYQTHYTIDAFLKSDDVNMLYIDWGAPVGPADQAKNPYLPVLVPETTDWLIQMHNLIDWDAFHVLSYAKGVEFISNVLHDLYARAQIRFNRKTTLAPPQELILDGEQLNDNNDLITVFIDAIHTDIGAKGTNFSRAHVDFYPNGGSAPQPGCPDDDGDGLCSRRRSFLYYAESVNNPKAFCAYKAGSYEQFESEKENGGELGEPIQMGRFCPPDARDKYFLNTNDEAPFGQGC